MRRIFVGSDETGYYREMNRDEMGQELARLEAQNVAAEQRCKDLEGEVERLRTLIAEASPHNVIGHTHEYPCCLGTEGVVGCPFRRPSVPVGGGHGRGGEGVMTRKSMIDDYVYGRREPYDASDLPTTDAAACELMARLSDEPPYRYFETRVMDGRWSVALAAERHVDRGCTCCGPIKEQIYEGGATLHEALSLALVKLAAIEQRWAAEDDKVVADTPARIGEREEA